MTKRLTKTPWGSIYTGSLSTGCQQCITGEKLVVLVTTDCTTHCFYCPLSLERKASTYAFANERPIKKMDDLILEATLMNAQGASMTGGDAIENHSLSQTLEFCRVLRKNYPNNFHIHVYTRGREITSIILEEMSPLIDEIRFHVINLEKDFRQVEMATQFEIDVGIEVPVIPTKGYTYYQEMINQFASFIPNDNRFYFVNLNELEISETNYRNLLAHGLKSDPQNPSAVDGSAILGHKIVKWANINSENPVHFCALRTKDTVQLPNRLYRIAMAVKLPSDVVIPDGQDKGLLIRGVIHSPTNNLMDIRKILITEFDIPEELLHIDQEKKRLLTNAAIVDEMKDEIQQIFPEVTIGIIEEYPTFDQLQTTLY
ncbi:MAG: 4Fe-4S cluster-binding domain-containing protein [Candidatus Hodarchaeales archaeon]